MIRRAPLVRLPSARGAALAALVLTAGVGVSVARLMPGPASHPDVLPASLADRLGPQTWAFAIPHAWIAAPLAGLREGDVLDLLGTRASERATATEIAVGLRVMSVDESGVVVELTAADAAAIAEGRARGLSFMPILRSTQ